MAFIGGVCVRSRESNSGSLLLQAQGVETRFVARLVQEAALLLQQASTCADDGDISAIMQGLPYVCGSVRVGHGRWRAVYRFVGQVLLVVVVPRVTSALTALDVLERCVRIVTFDLKEVTLDRLDKRFSEVHMALSTLLAHDGAMTGAQALAYGRHTLESIALQSNAVRAGKLGVGADGKTTIASNPVSFGSYKRTRTLANQAGQLPIQFGFPTGEALRGMQPMPGFEPHATLVPNRLPGYAAHQMQPSTTATADDMFSGLPGGTATKDDILEMLGPLKPGVATKTTPTKGDPFAFVASEMAIPAPTPPPGVPPMPLLRLSENWRAQVVGGHIVRAGLTGEVLWQPTHLATPQAPVVGFALQYIPGQRTVSHASEQAMQGALVQARMQAQAVQQGWPPGYVVSPTSCASGGEAELVGFSVDLAAHRMLSPTLLRYQVPAAQAPVSTPLQVQLGACFQADNSGHTSVLLGCQVVLAPGLHAHCPLAGLDVCLVLPALYELPARVTPGGAALDGANHTLTWRVGSPVVQPIGPKAASGTPALAAPLTLESLATAAGGGGGVAKAGEPVVLVFSAAFLVPAGELAARGALRSVRAEVTAHGQPGHTLTGTSLRQHGFVGPDMQAKTQAMCSWCAVVQATL